MEKEKRECLEELAKLDIVILKRVVELSKIPKALSFFTSTLQFSILKSYLK